MERSRQGSLDMLQDAARVYGRLGFERRATACIVG